MPIALDRVLDTDTLRLGAAAGLLRDADSSPVQFDEDNIDRILLICELRYYLDVEEASQSVILSLMDQLYDLSRSVRRCGDCWARCGYKS